MMPPNDRAFNSSIIQLKKCTSIFHNFDIIFPEDSLYFFHFVFYSQKIYFVYCQYLPYASV